MLNRNWEKVFDRKDIDEWNRLDGTTPPIAYDFQYSILERLLRKYYRSKGGSDLSGRFNVHQKLAILRRTMEELINGLGKKESFISEKENREWHERRDRDEDPEDSLIREDDLRRSIGKLSYTIRVALKEDVDLGRFWISPDGDTLTPSSDTHHGEWIMKHPEALSQREEKLAETYRNDVPEFLQHLVAGGWMRISGGVAEMYSEYDMPKLAKFLREHSFDTEKDSFMTIVQHKDSIETPMRIGDIVERYGNNFELTANRSITADSKKTHEWSCLMVDYPNDIVKSIIDWGKENIDDKKLYTAEDGLGRESHIHTTILYGIDPESEFNKIKDKCKPISVSLGKISKFKQDECDVIKIDVDGDDIHGLHKEIKSSIGAPGNKFPTYKPHITIAYVSKGSCDDLMGSSPFENKKCKLNKYDFSQPNGKHIKHVSSVPNPIKNNYDYDSEWQNRVRAYRELILHKVKENDVNR